MFQALLGLIGLFMICQWIYRKCTGWKPDPNQVSLSTRIGTVIGTAIGYGIVGIGILLAIGAVGLLLWGAGAVLIWALPLLLAIAAILIIIRLL